MLYLQHVLMQRFQFFLNIKSLLQSTSHISNERQFYGGSRIFLYLTLLIGPEKKRTHWKFPFSLDLGIIFTTICGQNTDLPLDKVKLEFFPINCLQS